MALGSPFLDSVVLVHERRVWDAGELEAARLIAPAIIQNRIRVQAEGQSAVGRGTGFQRAQQEAEFLLVFFRRQAQSGKYLPLDLDVVNADAATTQIEEKTTRLSRAIAEFDQHARA